MYDGKNDMIYPIFIDCMRYTDDIFWKNTFEELSYGKCPYGIYISNDNNINDYLYGCDKAVYPIGFKSRIPSIKDFGELHHDANTGIIAPGLFGAGIAFPRQVIDPFGGKELNVGLFKFMNDIRAMVPLWLQYGL